MKKLLFLFFIASGVFAQNGGINFDFDYSQFLLNDSTNYIEFYYQIEKKGLEPAKKENGNNLSVIMRIILRNQEDSTVNIVKVFSVKTSSDTTNQKTEMLGQFQIAVPFGKYKLTYSVIDGNNRENIKTLKDKLEVTPFPNDKASLSNIELGRNIVKSEDDKSIFYKNTYKVIPNPSRIYSPLEPVVFFYAEVYNLKKSFGKSVNFLTVVLNSNGEKVFQRKSLISTKNNSVVKVGQVNLKGEPTGAYNLMLAIVDTTVNYAYTSSKRFFLINPNVKVDSSFSGKISVSSRFSGMSSDEADLFFKKMRYIASRNEKNQFEELKTPEQKQRFLTRFWKNHDKNPATPRNEFMNEYMRRLDYVNRKFKTRTHPGYMTDMGRVYLTYGPPDTIDRYPNNISTKPYELWYYHNIEGGVVFVFVDMLGIGEYDLVHSTKRGEVNNIRWRQLIGE